MRRAGRPRRPPKREVHQAVGGEIVGDSIQQFPAPRLAACRPRRSPIARSFLWAVVGIGVHTDSIHARASSRGEWSNRRARYAAVATTAPVPGCGSTVSAGAHRDQEPVSLRPGDDGAAASSAGMFTLHLVPYRFPVVGLVQNPEVPPVSGVTATSSSVPSGWSTVASGNSSPWANLFRRLTGRRWIVAAPPTSTSLRRSSPRRPAGGPGSRSAASSSNATATRPAGGGVDDEFSPPKPPHARRVATPFAQQADATPESGSYAVSACPPIRQRNNAYPESVVPTTTAPESHARRSSSRLDTSALTGRPLPPQSSASRSDYPRRYRAIRTGFLLRLLHSQ